MAKAKGKSMNATALAGAIGKTRQTVHNWTTQEDLPRNQDGSYCLPDVIAWMLEREAAMVSPGPNCDSPALERYRMARAAMAEMDLKIKEGELIPVEDVHRQWALRVAEVAAGLEYLADRLPPLLLSKAREEMQQIIKGEVWRLRDTYARGGQYTDLGDELTGIIIAYFMEQGSTDDGQ